MTAATEGTAAEPAEWPGWEQHGSLESLSPRRRAVIDAFMAEAAGLPEITAVRVEALHDGPVLATVWAEGLAAAVLRIVDDGQSSDPGAGVSFVAINQERSPEPDSAAPGVLWLARRTEAAR